MKGLFWEDRGPIFTPQLNFSTLLASIHVYSWLHKTSHWWRFGVNILSSVETHEVDFQHQDLKTLLFIKGGIEEDNEFSIIGNWICLLNFILEFLIWPALDLCLPSGCHHCC